MTYTEQLLALEANVMSSITAAMKIHGSSFNGGSRILIPLPFGQVQLKGDRGDDIVIIVAHDGVYTLAGFVLYERMLLSHKVQLADFLKNDFFKLQ